MTLNDVFHITHNCTLEAEIYSIMYIFLFCYKSEPSLVLLRPWQFNFGPMLQLAVDFLIIPHRLYTVSVMTLHTNMFKLNFSIHWINYVLVFFLEEQGFVRITCR